MKRTIGPADVVRWRKVGGGSFYTVIDGKQRIIKPGEVFTAKLEEIPVAFRDTVKPVDDAQYKVVKEQKEATEPVPAEYSLKHRGGGYFDVFDSNDKQVNEKALRREAAEELIGSLT